MQELLSPTCYSSAWLHRVSLDVYPSTSNAKEEEEGWDGHFVPLAWRRQVVEWQKNQLHQTKYKYFIHWKHCFMWTKTMHHVLYFLPIFYSKCGVPPKETVFCLLCRGRVNVITGTLPVQLQCWGLRQWFGSPSTAGYSPAGAFGRAEDQVCSVLIGLVWTQPYLCHRSW